MTSSPILHPTFREARDQVLAELFDARSPVIVTGDAGTGKTLLMREVARVLRSAGWQVITDPRADRLLPADTEARADDAVPLAVLIDDASQVSLSQAARIGLLKNVTVVLAGPGTLAESVPAAKAQIHLSPLSVTASVQFVAAWLAHGGYRPDLLASDALVRVIELSRGNPGRLASLLSQSILRASLQPETQVSAREIDDAARRSTLPDARGDLGGTAQASDVPPAGPAPAIEDRPWAGLDPGGMSRKGPTGPMPGNAGLMEQSAERPSYAADNARRPRFSGLVNAACAGVLCGAAIGLIGLLALDQIRQSQLEHADAGREQTDLGASVAITPVPAPGLEAAGRAVPSPARPIDDTDPSARPAPPDQTVPRGR